MPLTPTATEDTGRRPAKRVTEALGMTDSLGDAAIFAIQATGCALVALWIAMAIQLDVPYWAASTVLITAQATRSQSLQKAGNRVLGTLVGLIGSIVIVALFPQHWWSFALALSAWIAACTFVACLLRALQAYAAALAGYTSLIVLSQSFGDPNGAFATALSRGSSVILGVSLYVAVTVVFSPPSSSLALARRYEDFFARARNTAAGVLRGTAGSAECAELMTDYEAFDEAIEEAATDGYWAPGTKAEMRRATLGMADILVLASEAANHEASEAATVAAALERATGERPVDASIDRLRGHARTVGQDGAVKTSWLLKATLEAMMQARAGLELLRTQRVPAVLGHVRRTVHRDYAAALYAGARAFLGTFAVFVFWILSRWPNGDSFILIVGIICCLFATRPSPIAAGLKFTIGTAITAVVALLLGFYVIPREETFLGLAATLAPFMLGGALGLKSRKLAPYCTPMNFFLLPMIGVQNQMSYDPSGFFNSVGAIVCGCCTGVVIFTLLPPPSRRVEATLLRWWIGRSADRPPPSAPPRRDEWRLRLYDRAAQLVSRLPDDERPRAFEHCRDIATALQAPVSRRSSS